MDLWIAPGDAMKCIRFEAGILLCRHVREMLKSEIFCGRKIKFLEGRGWISRTFTITGEQQDVDRIYERLSFWKQGLGE